MNSTCGPSDVMDQNGAQSPAMIRAQTLSGPMQAWRRRFHRRPELSFAEYQTAEDIARVLESIPGMRVSQRIGGTTGVCARVGQTGGQRIALRADMDALPITEPYRVEFASEVPGVMHACGHDAHMAILLGAAHLIAEDMLRGNIDGEVVFIFQPAEETPDITGKTGAPHLIDAGVLDGVDAVLALHMDPQTPVGQARLHDGVCMANTDNFRARIIGAGGHAGYPNLALDPLWLLVPVLEAIHGIRSRRLSPLEAAAVSVCRIQGGTTNNVIPPYVDLEGTLRSYGDEARELIVQELQRALSVADILGGHGELHIDRCEPAVVNNPALNRVIQDAVCTATRHTPLWNGPFGMGGEDFGFMSRLVPSALFFLGCAPPGIPGTSLHSPDFVLDERVLPVGAAIFLEAVRKFLREGLAV